MEEIPCIVKVLHDIAPLYTPSGLEGELVYYIFETLHYNGFEVEIDDIGNVMAVRGGDMEANLPMLSAHSDTVQRDRDYKILRDVGVKFFYDEKYEIFYSNNANYYAGFDDKVGVAIILCLANLTKLPFKVLIPVMEETGGEGVQEVPKRFISSSMFNITLDRGGDGDIITDYLGLQLAPQKFSTEVIRIARELGITLNEEVGTYADTYYTSFYTPGVNLSVGYYRPHQPGDFVHLPTAVGAMKIAESCIQQRDRLRHFSNNWKEITLKRRKALMEDEDMRWGAIEDRYTWNYLR